jgi:hypothetical protein
MQADLSSRIMEELTNPNQLIEIFGSHYLKSFRPSSGSTTAIELNNIIYNLKASYQLHIRIHLMEHILRRFLTKILVKDFGNEWYNDKKAVLHGYQRNDIADAQKRMKAKKISVNQHTIQDYLPFGFWVGYFQKVYSNFWKSEKRLKRFFGANVNTGYISKLGKDMREVRQIRNDIAHQACIIVNFEKPEQCLNERLQLLDLTLQKLKPDFASSVSAFIRLTESNW